MAQKQEKKQGREGAEAPKRVVDFQPDALEIANKPLPGLIRLGVWFPLFAVALAIFWAFWAQTDVVVQGGGKLVTNLSTIVMKPLDRVVINEIKVKLGDVVTNGQVLITFDPEINQAEYDRLGNEIAALEAQFERLSAEFAGKPFVAKEDEQFPKWQRAIYDQRQDYYGQKIRYYDKTLAQLAVSKASKQASKAKKDALLKRQVEIEGMYSNLYYSAHGVSLKEYIEAQMQAISIDDSRDQLANEILEIDERRESLSAEKEAFIQDWRNKISEEMVTVDRNLTSTRKQQEKQKQLLEYVCLRAPCRAVVHQIAEFSPGSGVREAEALITLIPFNGDDLELEAEVRPEDIGKIKVGATARVKLTAYQFQKYGTLDGVVRTISEDTLDRQVGGAQVKYYRVRLKVGGKLRLKPDERERFRLIPGMEAQCEIKCDTRRVIEYVLYPLIKAFDETAREP